MSISTSSEKLISYIKKTNIYNKANHGIYDQVYGQVWRATHPGLFTTLQEKLEVSLAHEGINEQRFVEIACNDEVGAIAVADVADAGVVVDATGAYDAVYVVVLEAVKRRALANKSF